MTPSTNHTSRTCRKCTQHVLKWACLKEIIIQWRLLSSVLLNRTASGYVHACWIMSFLAVKEKQEQCTVYPYWQFNTITDAVNDNWEGQYRLYVREKMERPDNRKDRNVLFLKNHPAHVACPSFYLQFYPIDLKTSSLYLPTEHTDALAWMSKCSYQIFFMAGGSYKPGHLTLQISSELPSDWRRGKQWQLLHSVVFILL